MANVKITQLPSATTPLTGTEVFPLVQGTTTKQVAITGLFTSPVMSNPTLGVVGQADLINATGLPIASGVSGLGAGIATFLGTPSSANLRTAVTDETGTGALVFANAPVLVAPDLGTPTFLVATNATGTAVGLTAGSAITNANLTGAVTSVGNATSLGSFTSAQLRTALTDETGAGSAVFATSPTITAPILNQINDTNNAQILGLSPTTSAVDYLVVKNGTGVAVPLHFYADGSSANIGLHIQPKGTGLVTISDGTDFNKGIRFRSSSSAASAVTLLDAVSTAGRVVTLPDATTTLVGRDTTDTLTNKTIAFSSNTFSGTLAIANGGTNASTAATAIQNLLPSYTGNGSKGLRLNSGATALEWVADGGGTVTSVGGTGTVSGISLSGTVTTSGNLTLGGTLDLSAYNGAGAFTTLSASSTVTLSGGTANGVTYLNGSKVLTSGSALTFDGTNLDLAYSSSTNKGRFASTSAGDFFIYGINGAAIIYDADGDQHVWKNSGSEAMRLTSTGLGIGTSSPTAALNIVKDNAASRGQICLQTVSASNVAQLTFYDVGSLRAQFYQDYSSNGDFNFIINGASANMKFWTNNTLRATLDSAGNLGLGVTPSAWKSDTKAIQISNTGAGIWSYTSGGTADEYAYFVNNSFLNSSANDIYVRDGSAAQYRLFGGTHAWFNAASGTAGNTISFTQAMTLDASGNLGVGTTSPTERLHVSSTTGALAKFTSSASGAGNVSFVCTNVATPVTGYVGANAFSDNIFSVGTSTSTPVAFFTNSTERARIDSSGNLLVAQTSLSITTLGASIQSNGYIASAVASSSNGNSNYNLYSTGAGAYRFYVGMGGTVYATSTTITAISDVRLKENIRDLDEGLATVMALKPRKFDWKEGKGQDIKNARGFIAQEFETVLPDMIEEWKDPAPEGEEAYKAINANLIPTLVKAMQEQQAIIESLKARLDAANL